MHICGLRRLLHKILVKGYAAREIHVEALIQDDASPDSIELCGFDTSVQVANLGSRVDTHISMGHQCLEDKMLLEMHQCVLLKVPLTLLTMVLDH